MTEAKYKLKVSGVMEGSGDISIVQGKITVAFVNNGIASIGMNPFEMADHIVRACNNHYELLESLEWLLEMAEYAQSHLDDNWKSQNGSDYQNAISQADIAIAIAKTQKG